MRCFKKKGITDCQTRYRSSGDADTYTKSQARKQKELAKNAAYRQFLDLKIKTKKIHHGEMLLQHEKTQMIKMYGLECSIRFVLQNFCTKL
jgi:hypothetical protein